MDMMKLPLINIIIPIFNVEQYLRKCIDSVLSQTYDNIRVILVDDGSSDGCSAICDDYSTRDKRVRTIHRENGGQSAARNSGLSMLFDMKPNERGEYVAFVDSDDYVTCDYIEFLYNLLITTNSDIAQCGCYLVYSEARTICKNTDYTTHMYTKEQALHSLCCNSFYNVAPWNKLYKLRLFHHVRFPESRGYEDTAVSHILVDASDVIAINMTPKYFYVQRYNSEINGLVFHEKKYQFLPVGDELADYVTRRYPSLERAANVKRVFVRLSTLSQMVNCNHYDRARIVKLKQDIKMYRWGVLTYIHTPTRDKLGILIIMLGWPVYRIAWKMYYRIVRRQK